MNKQKLLDRMIHRLVPGCDEPGNEAARSRAGRLEGWVSIVSNTVLAAVKVLLAVISGSLSLLTDAFHTLADSLTSVVVILGFRWASKPADEEHPFGHGRIESIASLVIGVLLAVASVELGRAGASRLLHPEPVHAPWWIIGVVAATALVKELMARFSLALAHVIESDALEADAWHHRSDVLATALVVVAFIASRYGLLWIDGVASIAVAVVIAVAAYQIIRQASQPLIGQRTPAELVDQISDIAQRVDGVKGVHDIVTMQFGQRRLVTLHAVMAHEIKLVEAHRICCEIESRLAEQLRAHATVHADPLGPPHEQLPTVRQAIEAALKQLSDCAGYHDLWVEDGDDGRLLVYLDISTTSELSQQMRQRCDQAIKAAIHHEHPDAVVAIQFDPPFCNQ